MAGVISRLGAWVFACAVVFAQTPENTAFEVASVKRSPPILPNARVYFGPARGGPGTPDPEQITWSYATLKNLIVTAYDVKPYQVSGPAWMDTERYDVIAKVPAGATKEQVSVMWRKLLAERFGVAVHRERKEFQVEELSIAKGGPKLKETSWDPSTPLPSGPPHLDKGELGGPGQVLTVFPRGDGSANGRLIGKAQPISQLTATLGNNLNVPVLDKTGLTGKYDYRIEFTMTLPAFALAASPPGQPAPTTGAANDPGPDLATVVQQQLGLKLTRSKAMLDVVVIDKVEKIPTDN